ncbi:hypothetical protein, partial [Pseudoalteromonas sp. D48-MNA-CIBAN-0056]|uniref:hypothetical protein n=1 Tax=Pseudoalteromonas sp. D48-MNA-CIBAN-0056 TaxID=3140417 RepID=UPI0033320D43
HEPNAWNLSVHDKTGIGVHHHRNTHELLIENGGQNTGPIASLDEEERAYTAMCEEYSLGRKMSNFDVKRTLQTVGMTCFVTYFKELSDDKLSTTDLIELVSDENVSESSARTKISAGRRIIREGESKEALKLITESRIVDSSISAAANNLILESEVSSEKVEKFPLSDKSKVFSANEISDKSIWQNKVNYKELNAKQQENYNMLKLGAVLADYGFDLIRLNDDWQGADCIANHIDGNTYLKVQLKGRLTIDKKYIEKDLYIAFRNGDDWYLYPHDELIEKLHSTGIALHTSSWIEKGHYSWPTFSARIEETIEPYKLRARS